MIVQQPFGTTGHRSTKVIFGAAALGGMSRSRADATLETVLRFGVNHIDTAAGYGASEDRLAPFLQDHRADVFLATPATFYALTKAATRCDGNEALFLNQILHDIRLVMLDDAHLMDDCFEAAVALLKMMDGTVPRFAVCASSVDFASVTALGRWLDFLPRVDATQTAGPNANVTSTTPGWNVACASMPTLVKRFGNEHRAVPVAVEVVGFEIPWAKTEFAFDKALDEKIAGVVTSKRFAKVRLVFPKSQHCVPIQY